MTLDELIVGESPDEQEEFARLCREALGSGAGAQLLARINNAVPPMMSAASTDTPNDPIAVGVREGRRELSAFLFRWSGTVLVTRT